MTGTPPTNRLRRVVPRLVAAGALCALSLALGGSAHAASAPTLGGWTSSADGNVIDMVIDNTTGLAGIHPFTEADFPEAESQFATGPFGSGLATVFWPGSAGGNFGSLSAELGIPSQLQPLLSQTNDPVKANAQYPAGPATAQYPSASTNGAIEMKSTANEGGTSATAALSDESVPSIMSFSSAKGTSSATASSAVKATSSSDLGDVQLFGGLIDIGSITSTATVTSTGTTSSGTTVTHVSGVTVLGQPASIGTDGLVLPKLASSLPQLLQGVEGPIIQNALQQEINSLELKITELPSSQTQAGPSDSITSGGLQIEITPPSSVAPALESAASVLAPYFSQYAPQAAIVPTLPGLLQGATLTITLGRATAAADSSPPFSFTFTPPPVPTSPVTAGLTPVTTPSVSGIVPVSSPGSTAASSGTDGESPTVGTLPVTTNPTRSSPSATPILATPISSSKSGVIGFVILGLAVAGGLGYGLWRVARMVLPEDSDVICPLGKAN